MNLRKHQSPLAQGLQSLTWTTSQVPPSFLILLFYVFLSTVFVRFISPMAVSHAQRIKGVGPGREGRESFKLEDTVPTEQLQEHELPNRRKSAVREERKTLFLNFTVGPGWSLSESPVQTQATVGEPHTHDGNGGPWHYAVCSLHNSMQQPPVAWPSKKEVLVTSRPQKKCSAAPRPIATINPVFLLPEPPTFPSAKPLCPTGILIHGLF